MRTVILGALFAVGVSPVAIYAQAPAAAPSPYASVSGTILKSDAAAKAYTVKTDKGESVVKYDDKTLFMRMPPGELDTKKATAMKQTELNDGDRVLARVLTAKADAPATRIFVFTKDDLAKRDEKTQEDWATRSITGIVQSVDASAKTAVIKANAPTGGKHDVAVDLTGKITIRRHNPDSAKMSDLKMSSISEIAVGDQLRVLGTANDDKTKVTAESVVTGAFRTMGIVVKTVDVAAGTITGTDSNTKKIFVVRVTPDTTVKRLSPMVAMGMARQLNPNFQMPGGTGRAGQGGGNAGGGPPAGVPPGGVPPAGGPPTGMGGTANGMRGGPGGGGPGGGGPGGGGRGMDTAKMIESLPAIPLAEVKPGEALIVYGLISSDLSKLTSLNVLAGAEVILTAAPKGGADPLAGGWSFGDAGGGQP